MFPSRLVYLTLLCLVAGCAGPKQTTGINDVDADIGSSSITVSVEESEEAAYRRAAEVLQDHGFQIESSDGTLKQITTAPLSSGEVLGPVNDVRLSVQVRSDGPEGATAVQITGQYSNQMPIEKRGQSGSPARKAWRSMHQVATDIGSILRYDN